MLQKILLRDAVKNNKTTGGDYQEKCPVVNLQGFKRIETFSDELTFLNDATTIKLVEISSEPHRNFFLVSIDNIVYKYDLVTK